MSLTLRQYLQAEFFGEAAEWEDRVASGAVVLTADECRRLTRCHDHRIHDCGCETHFLAMAWRSHAIKRCDEHAAIERAARGGGVS